MPFHFEESDVHMTAMKSIKNSLNSMPKSAKTKRKLIKKGHMYECLFRTNDIPLP